MELASLGNVYFDTKKPWVDAKLETTHERMKTTISCCLECLQSLALISLPMIPTAALELFKMLGSTSDLKDIRWKQLKPLQVGQLLEEPKILFKKVEDEIIAAQLAKLHAMSANA